MSRQSDSGEVITPSDENSPAGNWVPEQGVELRNLLDNLSLLDVESKTTLSNEAAAVLGQCISPKTKNDSTTGLVLGYVQSGKTLSFTAVAALARDNGFPLVIVITGIATNLLDQSKGRLEKDLRLQSNRKWRLFLNPKPAERGTVSDVLADWRDESLPDHRRQTVLIAVLKNGTHLRNLIALLSELDLTRVPVLVIDDEADQAGLNTLVGKGRESTTYQRLVALRQALPHHTYLQYTATPQAPLLINLIDVLSPKFAEVLTPGSDYVGGQQFFADNSPFVRVIPAADIPSKSNTLTQAPKSLIDALKLFFLGVAAGFINGDDQNPQSRNRSMLVHPSRETPGHEQFTHWIRQIRLQWLEILSANPESHERRQFETGFSESYEDLCKTVSTLPTFKDLVRDLHYAIRKTEILEVNARPTTPQPDWKITYPWILVGGQAMDRGFTVEGLTVTYMPRDMGVGNADTIQQRARFFGYKRLYLGYCRAFLEQGLLDSFKSYVSHEEDIRRRLKQHRGRPLSEWRRAFFLDSNLRPTRSQVLSLDYQHDTFSDDWFWPKVPYGPPELLKSNRDLVSRFVAQLAWKPDDGDERRTKDQVHLVADDVSLKAAYEQLLTAVGFTNERDSQLYTGVLLQIDRFLQSNESARCVVYRMSGGAKRMRSTDVGGEIPTLFQGANYADEVHKDEIYPGDDEIRTPRLLTIQLHNLEVREPHRGKVIAENVPTIAVWVPEQMSKDWLVQSRT